MFEPEVALQPLDNYDTAFEAVEGPPCCHCSQIESRDIDAEATFADYMNSSIRGVFSVHDVGFAGCRSTAV